MTKRAMQCMEVECPICTHELDAMIVPRVTPELRDYLKDTEAYCEQDESYGCPNCGTEFTVIVQTTVTITKQGSPPGE